MAKTAARKPKQKFSFKSQDIELQDLLLDPNNYRFMDNPTFKKRIKNKYHLPSVQESTQRMLEYDKNYQLEELKKSIRTNGYVPMERIIVVPYAYQADKYLVVEGNRRVAALKSLLREHQDGVIHLEAPEVASFSKIPCAVLVAGEPEMQHAQRVIMGIRHIAGPKEWGAYQQAQLITELHDAEGYDFQRIGDHLGISAVEAARRYRAMRALQFMEDDELYAERASPKFYRLFHELVSLPTVRERFGWDAKSESFRDPALAREFFDLIAPQSGDDISPKIATYQDVRKLKTIIGHMKAEASLLDPEQPFSEAQKIADLDRHEDDDLTATLEDIANSLAQVDVKQIRAMTKEQDLLIEKIGDLLADIRSMRQPLRE